MLAFAPEELSTYNVPLTSVLGSNPAPKAVPYNFNDLPCPPQSVMVRPSSAGECISNLSFSSTINGTSQNLGSPTVQSLLCLLRSLVSIRRGKVVLRIGSLALTLQDHWHPQLLWRLVLLQQYLRWPLQYQTQMARDNHQHLAQHLHLHLNHNQRRNLLHLLFSKPTIQTMNRLRRWLKSTKLLHQHQARRMMSRQIVQQQTLQQQTLQQQTPLQPTLRQSTLQQSTL